MVVADADEPPPARRVPVRGAHARVSELAFNQAVGMIEADDVLRAKCYIQTITRKSPIGPPAPS